MSYRPVIHPVIVYQPRDEPDPHFWCRVFEITHFGDVDRRFLDHRCDECRSNDKAVGR